MDVHAQGGGIHYTVSCVQNATPSELYDSLKPRLRQMLACGTTTLEAKSGYGLTLEAELKMLQVLEQAKRDTPLTISSTYCGAHAVPRFVAAAGGGRTRGVVNRMWSNLNLMGVWSIGILPADTSSTLRVLKSSIVTRALLSCYP